MTISRTDRVLKLLDGRRRRTRIVAVLGSAALIIAAAPSALANLSGSTFEGNDGNLAVDTTGNSDWVNAPNRARGDDLTSGSSDNAFGQGTKEDDANVKVVFGSIPPQKSDLTRFYVGSEKDVSSGDNFLYLGWERSNVLGSANMDFEINQSTQPDLTLKGAKTLARTAGDMLITFDFSGGGNPTLGLLRWVTTGAVSQCFSANALPCWGNRLDLSGLGYAEGKVNTATLTDSIGSPDVTLPAGTFGEASINLTDSGVFPAGGACTAFGSAFLKSRSSASFPAEVKDFVAPQPVDITNCVASTFTSEQKWVPNDRVTVSAPSGGNLDGSVSFTLYPSTDCTGTPVYSTGLSPITVSGASPQSVSSLNTTAVTSGGDFSWEVSYDSNNAAQEDIAATCKEVSSLTIDNDNTD